MPTVGERRDLDIGSITKVRLVLGRERSVIPQIDLGGPLHPGEAVGLFHDLRTFLGFMAFNIDYFRNSPMSEIGGLKAKDPRVTWIRADEDFVAPMHASMRVSGLISGSADKAIIQSINYNSPLEILIYIGAMGTAATALIKVARDYSKLRVDWAKDNVEMEKHNLARGIVIQRREERELLRDALEQQSRVVTSAIMRADPSLQGREVDRSVNVTKEQLIAFTSLVSIIEPVQDENDD